VAYTSPFLVRTVNKDSKAGGLARASSCYTELSNIAFYHHAMPRAFTAAVIGSEKKIGSTRSTMSPGTSKKFRLFSNGMSARRAPLSIPT